MKWNQALVQLILGSVAVACSGSSPGPGASTPAPAEGLNKVNHIIVVMMENHSFDNYFGALAYVPASPYHASSAGCAADDHQCVDGLSCSVSPTGDLSCTNSNPEDQGNQVAAFHATSRCVIPDLAHSWLQSHVEANFNDPNSTLLESPNDGFVRVNDMAEQPDNGTEAATDDPTMGFYTQDDLPFLYDLAQKFTIGDRYFAAVIGPTLPNRFYLLAATSFGHVTTADASYDLAKPMAGAILDLLDSRGVSWADYSEGRPQASAFRQWSSATTDPHFQTLQTFLNVAAGSTVGTPLPQVSLVDPTGDNDDHPPTDIQRGQLFLSQVVNAIRGGPYWKDSVVFITYDEHGGFYDHVAPPRAPQDSARTPDGIFPGQCADLSNPPASQQPGAGAHCSASASEALSLCPALAQVPEGQYPANCASFEQLGFRVPLLVISPFAKPHYVSHAVADHTSLLAFIEKRFLSDPASSGGSRLHLTLRDQYADTLEDSFDFDNAPSMDTAMNQAQPPTTDCTPTS